MGEEKDLINQKKDKIEFPLISQSDESAQEREKSEQLQVDLENTKKKLDFFKQEYKRMSNVIDNLNTRLHSYQSGELNVSHVEDQVRNELALMRNKNELLEKKLKDAGVKIDDISDSDTPKSIKVTNKFDQIIDSQVKEISKQNITLISKLKEESDLRYRLAKENTSLKEKIERLTRDKDSSENIFSTLKADQAGLIEELNVLKKKYNKSLDEIRKKSSGQERLEKRILELEKEMIKTNEKSTRLIEEKDRAEFNLEEITAKFRLTDKSLGETYEKLTNLQQAYIATQEEIKKVTLELRSTQSDINNLQGEKNSLEKDINTYKKELDMLNKSFVESEKIIARLEGKLEEKTNSNDLLEKELVKIRKNDGNKNIVIEQLKKEVTLLEDKLNKINDSYHQEKKTRNELEEKLTRLEVEADKLFKENKNLKRGKRNLEEGTVRDLKEKLRDKTKKISRLEAKVEEARREQNKAFKKVEIKSRVIGEKEMQLSSLSSMLEELNQRIEQIDENKKKLEEEYEKVKVEKALHHAKSNEASRKLEEASKDKDLFHKEFQEKTNRESQLSKAMDKMSKIIKDSTESKLHLTKTVDELNEERSKLAREIEEKEKVLNETGQKFQNIKAKLSSQVSDLKNESIRLKQEKSSMINRMSRLEKDVDRYGVINIFRQAFLDDELLDADDRNKIKSLTSDLVLDMLEFIRKSDPNHPFLQKAVLHARERPDYIFERLFEICFQINPQAKIIQKVFEAAKNIPTYGK